MQRGNFGWAFVATVALAIGAPAPTRGDDRKPQIPDLKVEKYTLAQRPAGHPARGPHDARRRRQPLVQGRLEGREDGADRVRPPVRAPDVPGLAAPRQRVLRPDREGRRPDQRQHQHRPDELLRDRARATRLELALWLESDRMGFLLPALTQAKLDNQRDVVKNERRQRVDNVPYGQATETMLEALYPAGPPLPPQRHRLDGRPLGRQPRRRLGLLPHLLQPEQRQPLHRRRLRPGRDEGGWSRSTSARSRGARGRPGSTPSVPDARPARSTSR